MEHQRYCDGVVAFVPPPAACTLFVCVQCMGIHEFETEKSYCQASVYLLFLERMRVCACARMHEYASPDSRCQLGHEQPRSSASKRDEAVHGEESSCLFKSIKIDTYGL